MLARVSPHLRENELLAVNLVDRLDDVVGFVDNHHRPLQPDAHGGARLPRQEGGVGHHNQLTITTTGQKERERVVPLALVIIYSFDHAHVSLSRRDHPFLLLK